MTPDPLDRVTQMLREAIAETGDVDTPPAAREVAIEQLADALRARARTRRRKRVLSTMAVAAGFALLFVGGAWIARSATSSGATARDLGRVPDSTGSATALRGGHSGTLGSGSPVAQGTELRTSASSETHLDFDSGTRVTLGGAARVRLAEQGRRKRFALEAGSLVARVAKLAADERFVVTTPDAEVEVRGTAFRVTIVTPDLACAAGSPTRVEVTEGVVVVRHAGAEQLVAAGERWPAACEGQPAAQPMATATPTATAMTATATGPSAPSTAVVWRGGAASPEASSRLAEQNDIFDEAMRMKRQGDTGAALASLDRLLTSYPSGPLSESASAERMRLLARTDKTAASAAASEYLRRHPRGFARAEAEAIAAGGR